MPTSFQVIRRFIARNLQAELDGLFHPFEEIVHRARLGVAPV
jgi:hypothetical protein